ncbi:unnamed protein product [Rhizoctonia solani]|uniref:Ricin B lectin domain-containing protein n=1 Tax=Rhizoctonia solani TaxID=456999 RepID=A0A8H3DGJ7_9AGAM|nr:unnamed protein product [Rhizoctonia solani]
MPIVTGTYQIKNLMGGTILANGMAPDGRRVVWGWTDDGSLCQRWGVEFTPGRVNCCTIQNISTGRYLAPDGPHDNCRLAGVEELTFWNIGIPEGSAYIVIPNTTCVADLDDSNAANGTTIYLQNRVNGPDQGQQKWLFEEIAHLNE